MALKDWKKIGERGWDKKDSNNKVRVVNNGTFGWSVITNYYNDKEEAEYFKTKSQALSYAKSYMENN